MKVHRNIYYESKEGLYLMLTQSLSLLGSSWIYSTYCDFLLTVCDVGVGVILAAGINVYSSIISAHYCDLFTCLRHLTW